MAKELYVLEHDPYYQRSLFNIEKYPVEFWNINETIPELSYLTHGYFRYYGKFPSKIGKLIIDDVYTLVIYVKSRNSFLSISITIVNLLVYLALLICYNLNYQK